MKTKRFKTIFFASALMCCSALAIHNTAANADTSLDRIVVIVNDSVITERELDNKVTAATEQLQAAHMPIPPLQSLRQQVLDQLIDRELQLQLAKNAGLTVDEATLNHTLDDIAKQHNITLEQLPEALKSQGLVYTDFRKDIHDQMLISQVQQHEVGGRVNVTEAEVNAEAKHLHTDTQASNTTQEYHIIDILIATPSTPKPTATVLAEKQRLAEAVLTQLMKGVTLEQLSGDSSMQGNVTVQDLGWRSLNDLPAAFTNALGKTKPGSVIGPIKAPNGLHLVQLQGVRGTTQESGSGSNQETHVRDILIKQDALNTPTDIKLRLLDLRNKAVHGESFAKLATNNSEEQSTSGHGGDMGWVKAGSVDTSFEQTMNKLAVGEISQPFQGTNGWHIIQVLGRREATDTGAMKREEARMVAYQHKFATVLKEWLRQLRGTAYIKWVDKTLKLHKKPTDDAATNTPAATKEGR